MPLLTVVSGVAYFLGYISYIVLATTRATPRDIYGRCCLCPVSGRPGCQWGEICTPDSARERRLSLRARSDEVARAALPLQALVCPSRASGLARSVKLTTQMPWMHYATFSKCAPPGTAMACAFAVCALKC